MSPGISYFFYFCPRKLTCRESIYRTTTCRPRKSIFTQKFMFTSFRNFRITTNPQAVLILRLLLVLLLMVFTRLLLYFLHPYLFPGITPSKLFYYAFTGMRFDIVAILYANALYILLLVLPFHFRRKKIFSLITDTVFYITNSILLLPNMADSAYYPFSLKRMTFDIFKYISTGDDTAALMPQFIRDFWYVFLIWIVAILILIFISRRIAISNQTATKKQVPYYLLQTLLMLLFAALGVLGVRGGFQLKPIGILSASQYAPSQETAIVLNSAFTLMRSADKRGIEKISYFADQNEMNDIFNVQKNYSILDNHGNVLPMVKKNVCVIILESFSAEYMGVLNQNDKNPNHYFTPFLDSIASGSLVFKGYSNGKRSIEGIPAILASLPTWMTEDFITSPYSSNNFNSLASLLKTEGYNSSFFHGGKNGTMGFDAFCNSAGFDQYYGKNEYPDQADFDGSWGIWDEPYLQYIAGMLDKSPQPFVSAVFTLSSHHPYEVPEKYRNRFRKGPLPIQETIMYTDYALQKFFETASHMSWFDNTVFVITTDHTSEAWQPFYQNRVGQYTIPIIFFQPRGDTTQHLAVTAQQTDIMPTILDMLHYPKPFIAFGNSLLKSNEPHFGLNFLNGNYQLIQNGFTWQTDHTVSSALYNFEKDSMLTTNLAMSEKEVADKMDQLLKAVIQQYNNRMIENRLTVK